MSDSINKATLHRILKNQNKNEILEFIQEREIELKETSKGGDTVHHLIFQNKNLTEKDVIELLETFVNGGVCLDIQNNEKLTVLHLAIEKRWRNVIELLIRRKVNILEPYKDGNSIAHHFIANENVNFHKFFKLEYRGYSNKSVEEMEKMESESASFVEWMVSKGFNFDVKNNKGESALHLSITYNLHHILLVLLKYTQQIHNIDSCGQTLLHLFFKSHPDYRRIDFIDEPVKKRYAAFSPRYATKLVKLMLDRGVCAEAVDVQDEMCIQAAIEVKEDMNVIKMLIDHLMKRCSQSNVPTTMLAQLFKSISCWNESRTDYFLATSHALIKQGANVNAQIAEQDYKMSLLYYVFKEADQCIQLRAIKFLDEHHADFSVLSANKQNLFHALASRKYNDCKILDELFELLVSKGCCDVNARNGNGYTPLYFACECKVRDLALVRKLVEHGAEVNCQNENGETPLHYIALRKLSVELAEYLLGKGADVNAVDGDHKRPLFYVADSDTSPLIPVFLKWGAYVNICIGDISPFFLAATRYCKKNTEVMLAYGADINDPHLIDFIRTYGKVSMTTLPILLEHWIKLKVAGLVCSEEYEILVRSDQKYENFNQKCLQEIEKLKGALIYTNTSVYNFLHMDFSGRRIYINNEKLKNIVDSTDLGQQFPQYFVLILATYRQTVARRKLLEPAKEAWLQLTNIPLPDECTERILGYLRIEDLVNMVEHDKDL